MKNPSTLTDEQLFQALESATESMNLQESLIFGELLKRFKEMEKEIVELKKAALFASKRIG